MRQRGLLKLSDAEIKADELSAKATQQRELLAHKQREAEEALNKIAESIALAADHKKEIETLTQNLQQEEVGQFIRLMLAVVVYPKAELEERRCSVERELQDVQPKVDAAREAVGCIKSDNLNEIRSLKMPPEPIRDVLEGVLTALGQRDMTWNNMRRFLAGKGVKDKIISFDAHNISKQSMQQVNR